jgi:hypothetical protein
MDISLGAVGAGAAGLGVVEATGTSIGLGEDVVIWTSPAAPSVLGAGTAVACGTGVGGATFLKKGRDRLPHPGILTSQPEEIRRSRSNIAEKMDKLLRVSRNLHPQSS